MADKLIAVKMRAEGGKVVKAELTEIGQEGERAFRQLDQSARGGGAGLQNVGFQIQDFAVQVAGGTDATRALAQQLPQLLSGFGLLGVAAGTLVAAGVPIATMLFDIGSAGKGTEENLKSLDQAIQALRQTSDTFTAGGLEDMRAKYGEINAELLLMIERQRQMKINDAIEAARTATAGLREDFSGLRSDLETIGRIEANIASGTMTSTQILDAQDAIAAILDDINGKYGLSVEQLNQMVALSDELAAAMARNDPSAAAATLGQILDLLDQSNVKYDESYKLIIAAQDELKQLPAALEQSLSPLQGLVDLAGNLWSNLAAAASVRINAAMPDPSAPPAGAPRPKARPGGLEFEVSETGGFNLPAPRRGGGGGRRGGGVDPAMREAQRLFDSTRTAAEKYEIELAKIEELHKRFPSLITDEVQGRAIEDLAKKFDKVDGAARDAASAVRSAFDGIFDDPKRALQDLAAQLAQMALYQQLGNWFPSIFGAGGLVPLAGARAAGGPVTGGRSYLIGERGPEIFTPGATGMITPNHKIGGGAPAPVVNVINNGPGTARAEQSRGPNGEEIVNVIIEEGIARGRQDRALAGRTGLRPQAVRR